MGRFSLENPVEFRMDFTFRGPRPTLTGPTVVPKAFGHDGGALEFMFTGEADIRVVGWQRLGA